MDDIKKEIIRKKLQKLIDNLTRISSELNSLDSKAKGSKNIIKENVIINDKIYNEEAFNQIEKEIKNISDNIDRRIIPNLKRELNQ